MNKKTIIIAGIISLFFGLYFMRTPKEVKGEMKVYMGPTCQCCELYANIMGRNYKVEKEKLSVAEMEELKMKLGVPGALYSCHTSVVDGYIVEGHIPMEAIEELRNAALDVAGIGLAGMPQGSPGMPGFKSGPFQVYEITSQKDKGDLFLEL